MGEAKEKVLQENQAEKKTCDICQAETDELFLCDRCSAQVCRDCFVSHDEGSKDGLCVLCNDNVYAIPD